MKFPKISGLAIILMSLSLNVVKCIEPHSDTLSLIGHRFLTFNAVIRVNQIEVSRDRNVGEDERNLHTPERVIRYRKAIEDTTENYRKIRNLVVSYHQRYGDEITFLPGAYFANAYNTREQVSRDLHDGLELVSRMVGNGYRPKSVVAGFLAAANQKYLAEKENIHVCQGNIWSQYAIDNQDGEGSVSYPFYPSTEHFCKPARGKADFIDCVNLDGWTCDFLAARREGFREGFNSRMGVGPIETIGKYGLETGVRQMLFTTAVHFDGGFKNNGFAWVTNCWEVSLPIDVRGLTLWLSEIRKRWPDVKFITQGEFGLIWRAYYKSNSFDYRFEQSGSGIGGSDKDLKIKWFMNKDFRLALLGKINAPDTEKVIDFTNYILPAMEPADMTRRWSLMGQINQKQTRPQDLPVAITVLPEDAQSLIKKHYPYLIK